MPFLLCPSCAGLANFEAIYRIPPFLRCVFDMITSLVRFIPASSARIICFAACSLLLLAAAPLGAQLPKHNGPGPTPELVDLEISIHGLLDRLIKANDDATRRAIHDSLSINFRAVVALPGSFNHPFASIKQMAILTSDDGKLRIYNWNVSFADNTYTYGCFFQWSDDVVRKKKRKKKATAASDEVYYAVEFNDNLNDQSPIANKYMTPDKWQGALYYDLITVKDKKDTYYMVLGWDGANGLINRKLIDVVTFPTADKVRMGAPVFNVEKGSPKRFIMEYADDVSASIKYRAGEKRFVFDHLAPRGPGLEGNPAFYGPDLTFDAFVYEKGKWVFESNVYITLDKEDGARPYIDPARLR